MVELLKLLFISKEKNSVWYDYHTKGVSMKYLENTQNKNDPVSHELITQSRRETLITTDNEYYIKKVVYSNKINYYIYVDMKLYEEMNYAIVKWYEYNVDKIIGNKCDDITIKITTDTTYKGFPIVVANPIDNETYESLLKIVNTINYPDEIINDEPVEKQTNYLDFPTSVKQQLKLATKDNIQTEVIKTEKTLIESIFSLIENDVNSRGDKIKLPYTRVYVDDNRSKLSVHIFDSGNIVSHFKRKELTEEELKENPNKYLYKLIGIGNHTETNEQMVIYKACYGDKETYCRPADMFFSKVDREKYPNAKQTFRFELADESETKNVL